MLETKIILQIQADNVNGAFFLCLKYTKLFGWYATTILDIYKVSSVEEVQ